MINRYGDANRFLDAFNPDLQLYASREWVRAYIGEAPRLACVAVGYGRKTALVWLCFQLEDINLFSGVREKMDVKAQMKLAEMILSSHHRLKVSELLLFFYRLKCGRYGQFYGTVSPMHIYSGLEQFMQERHRELAFIEEERQRLEQASRPVVQGISRAEYLRRKQAREAGQPDSGTPSTPSDHPLNPTAL